MDAGNDAKLAIVTGGRAVLPTTGCAEGAIVAMPMRAATQLAPSNAKKPKARPCISRAPPMLQAPCDGRFCPMTMVRRSSDEHKRHTHGALP